MTLGPVDPRAILSMDTGPRLPFPKGPGDWPGGAMEPNPEILGAVDQIKNDRAKPTGLFGVKGTARDILGVLGAAFSKNPAPYIEQRQRERRAAALEGFMSNPMRAIQRLREMGDGDRAMQLAEMMANQRREDQKAQMAAAKDRSVIRKNEHSVLDPVDRTWRNMAGLALDNPDLYGGLKEHIYADAKRRGLPAPSWLPDEFDEEALTIATSGALEPYEQARMDETERHNRQQESEYSRRTGIQQQRANLYGQNVRSSASYRNRRAGIAEERAKDYKRRTDAYVKKQTSGGKGGKTFNGRPVSDYIEGKPFKVKGRKFIREGDRIKPYRGK